MWDGCPFPLSLCVDVLLFQQHQSQGEKDFCKQAEKKVQTSPCSKAEASRFEDNVCSGEIYEVTIFSAESEALESQPGYL